MFYYKFVIASKWLMFKNKRFKNRNIHRILAERNELRMLIKKDGNCSILIYCESCMSAILYFINIRNTIFHSDKVCSYSDTIHIYGNFSLQN